MRLAKAAAEKAKAEEARIAKAEAARVAKEKAEAKAEAARIAKENAQAAKKTEPKKGAASGSAESPVKAANRES